MINVLYLTGSFFMLEIYDRVLPSRSVPTLVGLSILAAGLYVSQGVLDLIRNRILVRSGANIDEILGDRIYQGVVRLPLLMGSREAGIQPLRDLDTVRSFLSGSGPTLYAFHEDEAKATAFADRIRDAVDANVIVTRVATPDGHS